MTILFALRDQIILLKPALLRVLAGCLYENNSTSRAGFKSVPEMFKLSQRFSTFVFTLLLSDLCEF